MSIRGIRRALGIPRFTRRHIERDVDEELAYHVARRAERLQAEGFSPEAAHAEAARRFGDLSSLRNECVNIDRNELRQERAMDFIQSFASDLRFAVRSFRRAPGFAITALITLVGGISALTSIFSFFNAVYSAPLPYHDADRIVAISEDNHRVSTFSTVSRDALPFIRDARSFERVSAYEHGGSSVLFGNEPQYVNTLAVDTAFAPLFALRAETGRMLTTEEIVGDSPVAMISDNLWQTRFGADLSTIGKSLMLGGRSFRIVGVMPAGFRFPSQTDAFTPLSARPDSGAATHDASLAVLAKLRAGVTRNEARREMALITPRLRSIDSRPYRDVRLVVRDEMLDRRAQQFLPLPGLFLGAGLFLLLIACANVTSLFYVRTAERAGEMAVRASLGAGRMRLIRQTLTECLLLSTVAAVLGTALAFVFVKLFLHFLPTSGFPSWFHVGIDLRILTFVITTTALVTITVGLSPAREGTRFDLVKTLKRGGDGGASSSSAIRGSKRGLVVQLTLSVMLFVGGALLLRSFQHMTSIELGYPAAQIAMVRPFFQSTRDDVAQTRMAETVAEEAARVAGVTGSAISGAFYKMRSVRPDSTKSSSPEHRPYRPSLVPDHDSSRRVGRLAQNYRQYVVSDGYFTLLKLKVRSGRSFGPQDATGAAPVAMISAHAAALIWGSENPIGRIVQMAGVDDDITVIGVVDDTRNLVGGSRGFNADPEIAIYLSTRQARPFNPTILATSPASVVNARNAMLAELKKIDPLAIVGRETTMASEWELQLMITQIFGVIIAGLAGSALLLSLVGIYGVVAFGVAQRTREIGIRIALGGTTSEVLRWITIDALRFVSIGLVAGLVISVLTSRIMRILLYNVSPLDPLVYGAVIIVFGVVAMIACYLPARRVTRIDPLIALRAD